jgi:RNA polymerase sigma-70 factor (ECF subfamily)
MTVQASQNESALVCAAQQRDKESLQVLLTRNWAWLKGLVFGIVSDPSEVDDVLQDICVRVITKIDTLREPERFRPWLAMLARRQALRYRQQKSRRPVPLAAELLGEDQEPAEFKFGPKPDGGIETIEQQEQCRLIWEAAQSLPEKYRQVFVLQYASDLTYGQVAEILDLPLTTVQIRLVRARRMICDRLAKRDTNRVWEE